jgi:hypothetical protein
MHIDAGDAVVMHKLCVAKMNLLKNIGQSAIGYQGLLGDCKKVILRSDAKTTIIVESHKYFRKYTR